MESEDFDFGMVQGSDVVVYAEDGGDCNGVDMVVCVAGDNCVGECEEATVGVRCDSCKGNALGALVECLGCHLE